MPSARSGQIRCRSDYRHLAGSCLQLVKVFCFPRAPDCPAAGNGGGAFLFWPLGPIIEPSVVGDEFSVSSNYGVAGPLRSDCSPTITRR